MKKLLLLAAAVIMFGMPVEPRAAQQPITSRTAADGKQIIPAINTLISRIDAQDRDIAALKLDLAAALRDIATLKSKLP